MRFSIIIIATFILPLAALTAPLTAPIHAPPPDKRSEQLWEIQLQFEDALYETIDALDEVMINTPATETLDNIRQAVISSVEKLEEVNKAARKVRKAIQDGGQIKDVDQFAIIKNSIDVRALVFDPLGTADAPRMRDPINATTLGIRKMVLLEVITLRLQNKTVKGLYESANMTVPLDFNRL